MTVVGARVEDETTTQPTPVQLALLAGLLYVPFVALGYGNDIDITNIRRSGASILAGDYRLSRPPGAFAHELTTGVLDRVGGSTLVALGSAVAAVVALVALARIVERTLGPRAGRIAVVVVATQPWFWVAATSLGDYAYALAFVLVGIDAAQRDARVVAGVAFALAIGFRSASVFLVASYLLAEVTGVPADGSAGRDRWRPTATTGLVTLAGAVVLFVPPWLSVDRSGEFLQNQFQTGSVVVMIGRWGVKNLGFFGALTVVVLIVRAPVLVAAFGRFGELTLVRFAVYAAVATELLYLRFPWKIVHLLPMAVCLALLLAASPKTSNRLVAAVVVSQLLLALVSLRLAAPDVADAATTGRFSPGITAGVVVNDLACRLDQDFDGDWPDLDSVEADYAANEVFVCQAKSWRAGEGTIEPRIPGEPRF